MPETISLASSSSVRLETTGPGATVLLLALLLLGLAVAVLAYRDTLPSLSQPRRILLTVLRSAVFLVIVAMLAQPILHERREVSVPPGVLVLVDESASMGIQGATSTRLDQAWQLHDRAEAALGERGGGHRVWTGQGARRLTSSAPSEQGRPERAPRLSEGTDLSGLLVSAGQRHLEDNLAAILLLSDGVSTVREHPSLAGLGIPVFPIAVGDSIGPADLRLDHVRYPALAYRGERVQLDAEVVAAASAAGQRWVVLSAGGSPVDSVEVRWPEQGGRVPILFEVPADSLGLRIYQLEVEPLAGEPLQENNRVTVGFEVRKDRLRIAYVEARPSWNFHFLSRHASADPRFEFVGIHRAAEGWRVAGSDSTWSIPTSVEQMADVDLWVAGSLDDLNTLTVNGSALADAVRAGAGLLVLAGEPRRGLVPSLTARSQALVPLLPQRVSRWRLAKFGAAGTALGRGHPVLAVPTETEDLSTQFAAMPPLWGVLAETALHPDADLLLEAQHEREVAPLLATRELGAGTVAMWTGGPLWSWSFWRLGTSDGEDLFHALTGNLLYFLAEGGDRNRLRLILPQLVLAQGQDAIVRGLALDRRMQPDDAHDVWLEWAPGSAAEADSAVVPTGRARMELDPETPGGRRLPVPALPAGEYVVRLALEEDEERVTSDWNDLVMDPYSVEFQRPQTDRAALQRIAADTGGRLLSVSGLSDWANNLPLEPREAVLSARIDLWSSLWLFVPLLGLISAEWALRKRWGLI